jgi:hypothetical protein
MEGKFPWYQRWRRGIRAGEFVLVVGLWAAALAASDMVIAGTLFVVALVFGGIAIIADSSRSRWRKVGLFALLAIVLGVSFTVVYWRHRVAEDAIALPPTAQQIAEEVASRSKEAHVATAIVIDRESKDVGTNFHLIMRNTGTALVDILQMSNSTKGGMEQGYGSPFRKTITPGATLSRDYVSGDLISESDIITINISYRAQAVERKWYTLLHCRFIVPSPFNLGAEIYPTDCEENQDNNEIPLPQPDFGKSLSENAGILYFVLPEKAANGSPSIYLLYTCRRSSSYSTPCQE